jgi:hypothetical protein
VADGGFFLQRADDGAGSEALRGDRPTL